MTTLLDVTLGFQVTDTSWCFPQDDEDESGVGHDGRLTAATRLRLAADALALHITPRPESAVEPGPSPRTQRDRDSVEASFSSKATGAPLFSSLVRLHAQLTSSVEYRNNTVISLSLSLSLSNTDRRNIHVPLYTAISCIHKLDARVPVYCMAEALDSASTSATLALGDLKVTFGVFFSGHATP
jgi:hypothetical protein